MTVQLAQAYFGQRLAEQAVDVRRDVRDGLNRHLSDAEKLEREGFATRAQRLQATVARDKAEREYQKTVNDLATLKAALATLLRSGGEVQPVSPLFVQRVPLEPVTSFERTAQARQPQIARLRAMVAGRTGRARAAGQAEAADLRLRPVRLPPPRRNDRPGLGVRHRAEIHLPVTELAAGADQRRACAEEQAEAGLREAENQVALGVRKAWNELETARQQFVLLDSSIAQAQENLRLQELAFREGQATSMDVIDARLGLGGARVERAQAAYQYDIALARLLEISGQMDRFEEFRRRADEVIDHE